MQITKPKLFRAEASRYLREQHGIQLSPATLANMATSGRIEGPPFYRVQGMRPLYPVVGLDAWAERRLGKLVTTTTQARAQLAD